MRRVKEILDLQLVPRVEILKYGLDNESEAYLVESAAIDLVDVTKLTSQVRGHGSGQNGRTVLIDLIAELNAEAIKIRHPIILININQLYHSNLPAIELYDATRGVWIIDPQREKSEVRYQSVVREVYEIADWFPQGTTCYASRDIQRDAESNRYEFVGRIAPDAVRKQYRTKNVKEYHKQSAQNPIKYVDC